MLILRESLRARQSSESSASSSILAPMSATSAIIVSAAAEFPDFLASAIPLAASFLAFRSWSASYLALRHCSSRLMTSSIASCGRPRLSWSALMSSACSLKMLMSSIATSPQGWSATLQSIGR